MSEANPFAEAILIRPHRFIASLSVAVGLFCAAISLIDEARERLGAVPLVVGICIVALGLLRLHPQSEFIRIDQYGLTFRRMFLEEFYAWAEVKRFDAGWHQLVSRAIYVKLQNPRPFSVLRTLAFLSHNRRDILVVTWYFVDQFEMANKLNQWKNVSLQSVAFNSR